jgi:hypothetical protein
VPADLTRVDEWIYSVLNSDLQLATAVNHRIYVDQAPQNVTYPLVLYSFLGGADKVVTLRTRLTNAIFLIRAVGTGSSFAPLETMADRIDALMDVPEAGVIIRGVRISTVTREQPHQRKDMENGVPTVYLGGFYRIKYQPSDQ